MEYAIALIMAAIGIFLNRKLTPQGRKVLMGVILAYVVCLLGFRYRVGMDTIGYMKTFSGEPDFDHLWSLRSLNLKHEPGYLLICAICKLFTGEFWPVQMILALITDTCIFIFLYRYCRNVFVGIFLFFMLQCLYFGTEVIRESAAISIFLVNLRNAERGRWLTYYLVSLLSVSFHYSAIITWFLPLARFIRPNIIFLILCVVILGVTPLVERLNQLLSIAAISERIDTYTRDVNSVNMNWRIGEFLKTGIPAIITLAACGISRMKVPFRHFILLQILLCCGAFAIPVIFQRLTNYTTLFVTVTLANYLVFDKARVWMRGLVLSFVLLTQSYYYISLSSAWFPYVSVFNPFNDPDREALYHKIWKPV